MAADLLIRGGDVFLPESRSRVDIAVEDGKTVWIGTSDAAPDADSDLPDPATGDGDNKDPLIDAERDEALNILADLVQLTNGPKTASANTSNR